MLGGNLFLEISYMERVKMQDHEMHFVASRFNPTTDPDKPVVGETVEVNGKNARIVRVGHALLSEILTKVLSNEWYDVGDDADEVVQRDHTTRPVSNGWFG